MKSDKAAYAVGVFADPSDRKDMRRPGRQCNALVR